MRLRHCRRLVAALALSLFSVGIVSVPEVAKGAPDTRVAPAAMRPAGSPLSSFFEANAGQTDESVVFLARSAGYGLYLTSTEAVLSLASGDEAPSARVAMRFGGASASPRIEGEGRLAGTSNYLVGGDRSKWRTYVAHYERVRYREIYPGVDLVFYFSEGRLEYDFVVAPGADTTAIRLEFDGVERAEIDAAGDLALATSAGLLRQRAPVVYQEGAAGARERVEGQYAKLSSSTFGFEIGDYDRSRPLVVDPIVEFSTVVGSGEAYDVAVDAGGNSYVVGATYTASFPVVGSVQPFGGVADVFVAKLDPTGTELIYSTFFGGTDVDQANGVTIDGAGNAYVVGYTQSSDLPTVSAAQATLGGSSDAFAMKLAPSGASLVYSTYLGGSATDYARAVDVATSGEAFITGPTDSSNFPTVTPIQTDPDPEGRDAFVTKLSAVGSSIVYSTYLGGPGDPDIGYDIVVDAAGSAFVTGNASGGFPTTPGAFQEQGGVDAFVAKLAPEGTSLVYSTHLHGLEPTASGTNAFGLAIDGDGNAYVAGETTSSQFPIVNAAQSSPGTAFGVSNAFVTKFNASGTALVYSTYLGDNSFDEARAIAVDAEGNAYVTGSTDSGFFPAVQPLYGRLNGGRDTDVFVTKVSASGSAFLYSTRILDGSGYGIDVDGEGNAYVAGRSFGFAFPVYESLQSGVVAGAFVTKIAPETALDSVGVRVAASGAWFLANENAPGPADLVFTFGAPGSDAVAITGDWNGDGISTPGLYDFTTGTFFLKNSSAPGGADLAFGFGPIDVDLVPVVGDWDGDGDETIGLYDPSTGVFFLKNSNQSGSAELTFGFGGANAGLVPVTGDWDDDAIDTIGLYAPATGNFFLANENAVGPADVVFAFGAPGSGAIAIVGDWDRDGIDEVGLYAPATGTFFLTTENDYGPAEIVFGYGPANATPVTGDWDRQ